MNPRYYMRVQGVVRGPFELQQLQTMRARGQLQRFHEISSDRRNWIAAGGVVELFAADVSLAPAAPQQVPPAMEPPADTPSPRQGPPPFPGYGRFSWLRRRWRTLAIGAGLASLAILALVFLLRRTTPLPPAELNAAAAKILIEHCSKCHGKTLKAGSLDVEKPNTMLEGVASDPSGVKYLVPGDPDASAIWRRVDAGDMPQKKEVPLTAEEKTILKAWILAGAKFPSETISDRPHIAFPDVLKAIHADLLNIRQELRRHKRYFTLHHLHNNGRVSTPDLQAYRAALSKLLNSLSKHPDVAPPTPIDTAKTVFRIDLPGYKWNAEKWTLLERKYPDGYYHIDDDPALIESSITAMTGSTIPVLRGDWFIAAASVPPLYHDILTIPSNVQALERQLEFNALENIRDNRVKRAGFEKSGISVNNRLIERHDPNVGYYWISYDFKSDNARADLRQFPLGPRNASDLPDSEFVQDGGEVIFSLPNGLQAYMLLDAAGGRIDEAPVEVVHDDANVSRKGTIVNGVSCIACHKTGINRKQDKMREWAAAGPARVRRLVELLHPDNKEMDRQYELDENRFKEALRLAYRGLVRSDELTGVRQEPVSFAFGQYKESLNLDKAAAELDLAGPAELRRKIENNRTLQVLGLNALLVGDSVDRTTWETNFRLIINEL